MRPSRGNLLVRPAETEETIPGGRIILTQNAREKMAAHQCEVVAVGDDEICEDEDCWLCDSMWSIGTSRAAKIGGLVDVHCTHRTDARIRPGAWIYVRPRSLIDACHPTEKLYFIKQSDVLAVFSTEEGPAD